MNRYPYQIIAVVATKVAIKCIEIFSLKFEIRSTKNTIE